MFDPWVPPKDLGETPFFVVENLKFPKTHVSLKPVLGGLGLFLAPGTMKIESGVVFFIYWLWGTYGG